MLNKKLYLSRVIRASVFRARAKQKVGVRFFHLACKDCANSHCAKKKKGTLRSFFLLLGITRSRKRAALCR